MTDRPQAAVISWDWRQQPDLDHLARLIHDLSGGQLIVRQADTGSDQYALVLSTVGLDQQEADRLYQQWCCGMLGDTDIIDL